jgi:hypothetical protein
MDCYVDMKKQIEVAPLEPFELSSNNNSFLDKLDTKKKLFVDFYTRLNGNISDSCAAVPINRQTYYNWLDADKNFAMAVAEAELSLNDEIRQILIDKAGSGDMTAVIFYLKNRHPDFKQQPTTLVQVNNYKDVLKEINDN